MKRLFNHIINIIVLLLIFLPTVVNANIICNDGTVSPSCGDCHRGCCSHHGGCSNGSGTGGTTNYYSNNNSSSNISNHVTQPSIVKEIPKSNDASLKKVTIDNENIDIDNSMIYSTTKERVSIYVVANDDKATTEYDNSIELNIGDNFVYIKVIAEDGNVKDYKLDIIRERILSSNTNIKIIIDDEEVEFNSYKSKTIYLSNSKSEINIKYKLEDQNAKVKIIGNENLKVGKNEVIVNVTAENGAEQDYVIIIEKYGKKEGMSFDIVFAIIIIGLFVGIGYLVYLFIKKIS